MLVTHRPFILTAWHTLLVALTAWHTLLGTLCLWHSLLGTHCLWHTLLVALTAWHTLLWTHCLWHTLLGTHCLAHTAWHTLLGTHCLAHTACLASALESCTQFYIQISQLCESVPFTFEIWYLIIQCSPLPFIDLAHTAVLAHVL